jgi:hypothetical protein
VLLVSALLPWYGGTLSPAVRSAPGVSLPAPLVVTTSLSGWETFTMQRWLWIAAGIAGLALAAGAAAGRRLQTTVAPAAVVMGLAGAATLCIAFRVIHHPHAALGAAALNEAVGIQYGAYVGLLAAAALTRASYRALAAEGIGLGDVRRQINRALGDEGSTATVKSGTDAAEPAAPAAEPSGPTAPAPPSGPTAPAPPPGPPARAAGGIPPMAGRSQRS